MKNSAAFSPATSHIDWRAEPDLPRLKYAKELLREQPDAAVSELEALANRGSVMSMIYLAWAYSKGDGVVAAPSEAIVWFRRAIDSGSVVASFYLGNLYRSIKKYDEAIECYKLGVKSSFPPSIYRLGRMFFDGEGGVADPSQAYAMWEKAANLGHLYAKRNVGLLLMRGHQGILSFPSGMLIYLSSIFGAIGVALKDPSSDRLM